jgi:REP element-mobilizing transposase RayT
MMSHRALYYHIVFSTKERRPLLVGGTLDKTCRYMGGIARKLKGELLLANGTIDHVHVAANIPASMAVADFVRALKANSSGWLHQTLPTLRSFQWQDGYAAFTVSPSVLPQVTRYIARQAAHHRKRSFQDELVALLEKHGVQYDERYIWR